MNKKKFVVLLLVVIMVLTLAATALVGCKDEDEEIDLGTALETVVVNSVEANLLHELQASAQISVKTNYGGSEKELLVKLAGNLALDTVTENPTSFSFSITDAKANTNVLHVYYLEYVAQKTGSLYLVLGAGESQQRFVINAISVKDILKQFPRAEVDDEGNVVKDKDGNIVYQKDEDGNLIDCGLTDEDSEAIGETITDALSDFYGTLGIIAGVGTLKQTKDNNLKLTLDLAKALNDLSDLLSVIDEYTEPIGLNLTASNIASVLPGLNLDLTFKLKGAKKNNFDNATFAGVSASISVKNKDMKINRTDNTTFVEVNIAKNFKLDLGLDFKFGADATKPAGIDSDWNNYKSINALNFVAEGELTINNEEGLGVNMKISDTFTLSIAVPKDTYSLKLAVDVDPFKLISLANMELDFSKDLSGAINSIAELQALKYVGIEITPKSESNKNALKVYLFDDDGELNVRLTDLSLIGSLGEQLKFLGSGSVPIGRVLDAVMGLFPSDSNGDKEEETPTETPDPSEDEEEEEETEEEKAQREKEELEKTLALVKTIVNSLTVLVNQPSNASAIDIDLKEYTVVENYKNVQEVDADGNLVFTKDEKGNDVPVYVQKKDDKGELVWETDKKGNFVLDKDGNKIPVYEKELIDTTKIAAKVKFDKTKGLNINATLSGMVIDGNKCGNLTADINVNKDGVTIAVKAPNLKLNKGEIDLPIDLVIKLTKFELGTAVKPF